MSTLTVLFGPGILPYYGIAQGHTGAALPYDGSLPLVGKTNACDIRFGDTLGDLCEHGDGIAPDFLGIVLCPIGLRVKLTMVFLQAAHFFQTFIEKCDFCTGG